MPDVETGEIVDAEDTEINLVLVIPVIL